MGLDFVGRYVPDGRVEIVLSEVIRLEVTVFDYNVDSVNVTTGCVGAEAEPCSRRPGNLWREKGVATQQQ